ncbi:MAG: hypothetical protein ACREAA_01940 [Candidatus Polarisedimenticolia bacterium]
MKQLTIAFLLTVGAWAHSSPVSAWPIIEVTACDTLNVDPLRVQTTFDIYVSTNPVYCWFFMWPAPAGPAPEDSTHFFDCGAPPNWTCNIRHGDSRGGPIFDFYGDLNECIGERVAGFWIVSDQEAPCIQAFFGNPVIGDEYFLEACFRCDMPVPAQRASWGSVKSRYR